jgi:hypothetical protein
MTYERYDWDGGFEAGREAGKALGLEGEALESFASHWASRACCVHMLARGFVAFGQPVTKRIERELFKEIVEHETVLYAAGMN